MIDPRIFIGQPLVFRDKILLYPPSVTEVVSNLKYNQMVQLLTLSQEDITDEIVKKEGEVGAQPPTPLEFLLINCYYSPVFQELTREAFRFFLHDEIVFFFEEKKILIGKIEEAVLKAEKIENLFFLNEENYFEFQNLIRILVGRKEIKPPEPPNPNEDPRITRMKAKARERDRIKARKGTTGGILLATSLVAICCMGIGITPLNIGEMSYAAIEPLMSMMQNKEKYDTDVRSLLAGADSKKVKPKYWIRNLD